MTTVHVRPPLERSRRAVVAGVCAGLALHLGWPVRTTRVLAVLLTGAGGAGLLLYLWLWALVPLERPEADDAAAVHRATPVAALLLGLATAAALIAGVALVARADSVSSPALLAATVAAGAAVAWNIAFDRSDPRRSRAYSLWIRALASLLLLLAGSAALVSRPSAANAVLGVGMLVLGIGLVAAPRIVALWRELLAERAARVRQEQRAEIAAHLHDSVLQTLALIQNRAGASSEVARIARAQERELRDWLFAGGEAAASDLATELRETAAAIELDYPARIEVVTAGEPAAVSGASVERSSAAILAAAREAMLNAARHAGGDVSVYLESSASTIDVFVRDRGPGVDLAALPDDRLGVRESIIGRMTRAGGTATVKPGAGGKGTEVHLHLEVVE